MIIDCILGCCLHYQDWRQCVRLKRCHTTRQNNQQNHFYISYCEFVRLDAILQICLCLFCPLVNKCAWDRFSWDRQILIHLDKKIAVIIRVTSLHRIYHFEWDSSVKKFSIAYGFRKFLATFTAVRTVAVESIPHPLIFLKTRFNTIVSSKFGSSKWSLSIQAFRLRTVFHVLPISFPLLLLYC